MPWRMAFVENTFWDDWFFAELVIDFLFFIDVIVNCLSAYYNNEGILVTSRSRIFL